MAFNAAALRELHRIHRQLSDLRERLDRGPKQIKARQATVAAAEERLAKTQAEFKAARVAIDQKQLLLKTGEGKIIDLKVKLNACSTNREYQALRDQIAADEMANSVLADEILEALEKADLFKHSIAEAEQQTRQGQGRASQGAKRRARFRGVVAGRSPSGRRRVARLRSRAPARPARRLRSRRQSPRRGCHGPSRGGKLRRLPQTIDSQRDEPIGRCDRRVLQNVRPIVVSARGPHARPQIAGLMRGGATPVMVGRRPQRMPRRWRRHRRIGTLRLRPTQPADEIRRCLRRPPFTSPTDSIKMMASVSAVRRPRFFLRLFAARISCPISFP